MFILRGSLTLAPTLARPASLSQHGQGSLQVDNVKVKPTVRNSARIANGLRPN